MFCAGKRARTDNIRGSGAPPPKIRTCRTWPAIVASLTPADPQRYDARIELSQLDPGERNDAGLPGLRFKIGGSFTLDRDDGHVVPGLASGPEDQARKVAVAGYQANSHALTYSTSATSSSRRDGRRRMTPRRAEVMKFTRYCTSGTARLASRSMSSSARLVLCWINWR